MTTPRITIEPDEWPLPGPHYFEDVRPGWCYILAGEDEKPATIKLKLQDRAYLYLGQEPMDYRFPNAGTNPEVEIIGPIKQVIITRMALDGTPGA